MQLTIGNQNSDRTTLITDATWEEYQNLSISNCLVSFRQGVITIVSPGKNHEIISDLIRAVIWGYCRRTKVLPFTFNQTRLTYAGKEGKEPDVAYSFGEDKERPDLAVEVNFTSGNIDDLTKYQYLNIPEVWLWEQNSIRFFVREQAGYLEVAASNCLPGLESDRVTEIINASFGKSPLEVEQLW
jgi:Uma2 family endonuclease